METTRNIISVLRDEMMHNISGGLYNKLQVDFAFNSNHMEGSCLSHEQTRYIYETYTVAGDNVNVNDIIETVNHFECFKYILNTFEEELSEKYIKHLHKLLKTGTLSARSNESVVGDYKKYPNCVGDLYTTKPEDVSIELGELLRAYNAKKEIDLVAIAQFHSDYEKIHPFYDGNGRTGRLIMLKECLKNDIVPFFIDDTEKRFYYEGLHRCQTTGDIRQLESVLLLMQDDMKAILDYFGIVYDEPAKGCVTKESSIAEVRVSVNNDITSSAKLSPKDFIDSVKREKSIPPKPKDGIDPR